MIVVVVLAPAVIGVILGAGGIMNARTTGAGADTGTTVVDECHNCCNTSTGTGVKP